MRFIDNRSSPSIISLLNELEWCTGDPGDPAGRLFKRWKGPLNHFIGYDLYDIWYWIYRTTSGKFLS